MSDQPNRRQSAEPSVRETERILADWLLSEAPPYEPPVLLPAVLARTALTRHRPAWRIPDRWLPAHRAWRPNRRSTTPMDTALRFVAASAVLAVAGSTFAFLSSPSPQPPGSRTIVVAQDGSGDFTTISDAVAIAQDGDTVLVRPGTYAEQVTIARDITLRGDEDDRALVVIAPPADGAELPPGSEPLGRMGGSGTINAVFGVFLSDSDATIADLTVLGLADGFAVVVHGGAPTLRDLTIDIEGPPAAPSLSQLREGLSLDFGTTAHISGLRHEGWLRVDRGSSPTLEGNELLDTCVVVWGEGSAPLISSNTVTSCLLGWSFDIAHGSSPIIEGNTITGGIDMYVTGTSATIRENRIEGGSYGVQVDVGVTATIEGNEILGQGKGIAARGIDVTITGNQIHDQVTGIDAFLGGSSKVTITGNTITDSATGIRVGGSGTPVVTGNTLCGNQQDLWVPADSTFILDDSNSVCGPAASGTP